MTCRWTDEARLGDPGRDLAGPTICKHCGDDIPEADYQPDECDLCLAEMVAEEAAANAEDGVTP
jgi:hypothetical protein